MREEARNAKLKGTIINGETKIQICLPLFIRSKYCQTVINRSRDLANYRCKERFETVP